MKIPYFKYSPCGNITIFLEAKLSPSDRMSICKKVILPNELDAEQAGIINVHANIPRLEMMGGEFCLNASRAYAFHLMRNNMLNDDGNGHFSGFIASSGISSNIKVEVDLIDPMHTLASVTLPVDGMIALEIGKGVSCVKMDGITHLLLNEDEYPIPQKKFIHLQAEKFRKTWKINNYPAVGVIWIKYIDRSKANFAITPYVWVRDTNTSCLETSCGSASLALAFALRNKFDHVSVIQPSGDVLNVNFISHDGNIFAKVNGKVDFLSNGFVDFNVRKL